MLQAQRLEHLPATLALAGEYIRDEWSWDMAAIESTARLGLSQLDRLQIAERFPECGEEIAAAIVGWCKDFCGDAHNDT